VAIPLTVWIALALMAIAAVAYLTGILIMEDILGSLALGNELVLPLRRSDPATQEPAKPSARSAKGRRTGSSVTGRNTCNIPRIGTALRTRNDASATRPLRQRGGRRQCARKSDSASAISKRIRKKWRESARTAICR
jgi:hypothetical protein